MRKFLLSTLAAATLMACATPPAPDTALVNPPPGKDTCNAAQYAGLIGKPVTDPAVPAPSRQVRHIRPDSVVTMDFSPTRLNIDVDARGVITGLRCF